MEYFFKIKLLKSLEYHLVEDIKFIYVLCYLLLVEKFNLWPLRNLKTWFYFMEGINFLFLREISSV